MLTGSEQMTTVILSAGLRRHMRVHDWIIERCDDNADAVETAIGLRPKPEDTT
jgi:GTP-dependent phosphoenolpyruvate carboxykinase